MHGITWVKDRDQFLASIGILVADNTSLLFEACAHDRVAVVLNHPGYRRHVHHGLRFWTASDVGVQCDSTVELENCIVQASNRLKSDLEYRDSSLAYVYDKDRPTLRTCLYLESALDMLKQRRSGTPTVTVRAITDFDTGPGNPVPLGALRIMTAVKAKEYAAIGMIEILDEQQYREVVLRPHERDQGVWRLLTVPKDRAYKVLRADEIDGKKIKPGEILLKGDLSTESMDELQKRNSVVQYDSDRRITKERETKCASGS